MGAISTDLPANQLASGPMMTSRHDGNRLGARADCRRFWAQYRARDLTAKVVKQIEGKLATTAEICANNGERNPAFVVA